MQRALHPQELAAGHQRVDRGLLERDADRAADLVGLVNHVVARDEGRAGGWAEEGGEDADEGGLAGAVGAEKAVDLAGVDLEVEVVDGADGDAGGAEVADEGGDCDGAVDHPGLGIATGRRRAVQRRVGASAGRNRLRTIVKALDHRLVPSALKRLSSGPRGRPWDHGDMLSEASSLSVGK